MTQTATQQTESMEDILHSIRRIIANDPADESASVGIPIDDEPLELTEVVESGSGATVDPMNAIEAAMVSTGVMDEPIETPAPKVSVVKQPVQVVPPAPPQPKQAPVVEAPVYAAPPPPATAVIEHEIHDDSLLADNVVATSTQALKNLVNNIPKPKVDSLLMRSGSTLEDLVVESLKPELSEWLNKNLPTLVQSLVEKEIRKLIPRD